METASPLPKHGARGAHLIQCLVGGAVGSAGVHPPLNKILCGLGEDDVLPAASSRPPEEEEMVSGLLSAILTETGGRSGAARWRVSRSRSSRGRGRSGGRRSRGASIRFGWMDPGPPRGVEGVTHILEQVLGGSGPSERSSHRPTTVHSRFVTSALTPLLEVSCSCGRGGGHPALPHRHEARRGEVPVEGQGFRECRVSVMTAMLTASAGRSPGRHSG